MAISDWPVLSRPRERLLASGAKSLSDSELLAVLLRAGVRGQSALDLAHTLIARFGSLARVLSADREAFCAMHGLGPARYAELHAVRELARRALGEQLEHGALLDSPQAVREYLRLLLGDQPHEVFAVLLLDARNRLLACQELFRGTLTHTAVYPREVVKAALAGNAAAVILAHNHPSGAQEPSGADLALTAALKSALALVDVRVLDHFVVTAGAVFSFAEHGLL
jgi:DNA repair protein RadC